MFVMHIEYGRDMHHHTICALTYFSCKNDHRVISSGAASCYTHELHVINISLQGIFTLIDSDTGMVDMKNIFGPSLASSLKVAFLS